MTCGKEATLNLVIKKSQEVLTLKIRLVVLYTRIMFIMNVADIKHGQCTVCKE